MHDIISNITKLIKAKRWDDVKKELHAFFASGVTGETDSAKFVNFVDAYVTVSLEMEKMYGQELDKAMATLQALNKTEAEVDDAMDLEKVQQKIKDIG
ncbi:MAG: hypothetical protein Q7K39_04175 [Candidatus Magasanikbacteria bacterium]|nr:hypothetical protein [Candidatus Magasanikbacteria bacterium]